MNILEIKKLITDISEIDLDKRSRKGLIPKVRFMYYYLAYKYADGYINENEIAKTVPFDRGTVIYGIKEFPNMIRFDQRLNNLYLELDFILKNKTKKLREKTVNIESVKETILIRKNENIKNRLEMVLKREKSKQTRIDGLKRQLKLKTDKLNKLTNLEIR